MAIRKKHDSINYYFLNKRIFPDVPKGYRQAVINLLINRNITPNKNKFLFVKQKWGTWGFSRQSIISQNLPENLFETLVKNIGEELGFRGPSVYKLNPRFIQKAYFFNFNKQKYDDVRAGAEIEKVRQLDGKVYHLAVIDYKGPEELPIDRKNKIILDFAWVDKDEARMKLNENYKLLETSKLSKNTMDFHVRQLKKVLYLINILNSLETENFSVQPKLL